MGSRTSRGGPENKIHIRKVQFPSFGKLGIFSVETGKVLEGSGGSHKWAHDLGRLSGLGGCCMALLGHVHQPHIAHAAA